MKTAHSIRKAGRLAVTALALWLGQTVASAVTFTSTPAAVSNQYAGVITLQIAGLTNGETVVVQKFLDANGNGAVDAGDFLVQQFQLTDGQGPSVIGGVTNLNIPYDANAATGAITAQLNLEISGVEQEFVGQFAYVLSSPTGRFASVTNLFNVTNSAYTQSFTGTVLTAGTNVVPNALVMLGSPGNNLRLQAGAVANGSGSFTLKAAPGTYKLIVSKFNFVYDVGRAPVVTLGSGATVNTNLTLLPADQTISGRFVDATNASLGLPGILLAAFATNGIDGFSITDPNGNFIVPISSSSAQWGIGEDQQPLSIHGYVGLNNQTNVITGGGSVSGVTLAFPQATALLYGTVLDNLNNPLPRVSLSGDDGNNGNGAYQGSGRTDQNGNYVVGALAGTWSVSISGGENSALYGNYIFSQGPPWTFNNGGNGTNLSAGMAVPANFTGILATNQITGYLTNNTGSPFSNVQINANASINGVSFNAQANTDGSGHYALNVANGSWNVSVNCFGGNNSLPSIYQCPNNQTVNITNNNGVANFVVQSFSSFLSGRVLDSGGQAVASMNVFATTNGGGNSFQATTDSNGNFLMGIAGGSYMLQLNTDPSSGAPALGLVSPFVPITVTGGVSLSNLVLVAQRVTGSILASLTNASNHAGIAGINLFASATLNGTNYTQSAQPTDASGKTTLQVFNGFWDVSADCNGLSLLGYNCANDQFVTISNNTGAANLVVQSGGGGVPDVTSYTFSKKEGFVQTGPGTVVQDTNLSFGISFSVLQSSNGTVLSASVTPPGGAPEAFPSGASSQNLKIQSNFTSQASLDAAYPSGNYTFILNTAHNGSNAPILNLPVTAFPNAPQINNFSAAQTINANNSFLLQWNAFTSGGAGDLIDFSISDTNGNTVLSAPSFPSPGWLNGTATSFVIPPGTLQPGQGYQGQLSFNKTANFDTNSYPGAVGAVSFKTRSSFALRTAQSNPGLLLTGPRWLGNGEFQYTFNTAAGVNYTLQVSADLKNWVPIVTLDGSGGPLTVTDPNTAGNRQRFYRVKAGP